MSGRSPDEPGRVSSPLELFVDLTFVVGVAAAAEFLRHGLAHEPVHAALIGFGEVFFAIWWAWVNYSWLASAYDPDDVLFRLQTFVVMIGVLILAVGIPNFAAGGRGGAVVAGYVVMRIGVLTMWLRVAHDDPPRRATAMTYVVGVGILQVLWVARYAVGEQWAGATFIVLALAEMAIPWIAERREPTPWHPEHIAERYSLFTIIVLGEVLLANSQGISTSIGRHGVDAALLLVVAGGLVAVFALWWRSFSNPNDELMRTVNPFFFGYAHYFVFASVAAVGAGLGAVIESLGTGEPATTAELAVLGGALGVFLVLTAMLECLPALATDATARRRVAVPLVATAAMLGLAAGGLPSESVVALMGATTVLCEIADSLLARRGASPIPAAVVD